MRMRIFGIAVIASGLMILGGCEPGQLANGRLASSEIGPSEVGERSLLTPVKSTRQTTTSTVAMTAEGLSESQASISTADFN